MHENSPHPHQKKQSWVRIKQLIIALTSLRLPSGTVNPNQTRMFFFWVPLCVYTILKSKPRARCLGKHLLCCLAGKHLPAVQRRHAIHISHHCALCLVLQSSKISKLSFKAQDLGIVTFIAVAI